MDSTAAPNDSAEPEINTDELAKQRANQAWEEFRSALVARAQIEQSVFAGAEHAQLHTTLGNFRIFKTVNLKKAGFSSVFKANILLFAVIGIFYGFTMSTNVSTKEAFSLLVVGWFLPVAIIAATVLTALALLLWYSRKPKRVKILANMIVLRTDLNPSFFSELVIPWQSIEKVVLTDNSVFSVNDNELGVEISTALGVKHFIPMDDLLVDNSQASFITAVRTWAPWAAKELTFEPAPTLNPTVKGARLTELWLHQFNNSQERKQSGLLAPGTEIAGYTVVGLLGGGGQGNTYLAVPNVLASENHQQEQAAEVVLKEYIMPVYRGSLVLSRLSQKLGEEASLLARLDHPAIVKVLHHFIYDYRGYLVLEYVKGLSLKEVVNNQGPQSEAFVIDVAKKLLAVLAYMHGIEPAILHRDLSPDNIMIADDGKIKVVDFNVARQLESSAASTVVGKHAYIPPEQFRGRPLPASDIYALGATLFFLLTGEDPEPLSSSHPRQINKSVSVQLDLIVAKATNLDLDNRYKSAAAMLEALSSV